jgi:hypothetical protein
MDLTTDSAGELATIEQEETIEKSLKPLLMDYIDLARNISV